MSGLKFNPFKQLMSFHFINFVMMDKLSMNCIKSSLGSKWEADDNRYASVLQIELNINDKKSDFKESEGNFILSYILLGVSFVPLQ